MSHIETAPRARRNRARKTLQVLQPAAGDSDNLVPKDSIIDMSHANRKKRVEQPVKLIQPSDCDSVEKENAPSIRRSKRKNGFLNNIFHKDSSKEEKMGLQKSKTSKTSRNVKKSVSEVSDSLQTKLDYFLPSTSSPSAENDSNAALFPGNVTVITNGSDDIALVTSDIPSERYWREIAESRRIALEKALYENEQLCDQLEVLQAENSRMKESLQDLEKIAAIVNDVFA